MKKIVVLALLIFVITSCEKPITGVIIDADVSFSFVNSKGENLLNPNTPDAVTEANTDIYVLQKGAKVRLYRGNLDSSKFFKIRNENNRYFLQMYFDIAPENFIGNKITQFIRHKDGSEDEIVAEFNSDRKRNTIIQQVWINGTAKTKTETANSGESPIIIMK